MEEIDISDQKLNKTKKDQSALGACNFTGTHADNQLIFGQETEKKNQTSLISLYPRRKKGICESDRIRLDILTKQI